MTFSINKKINYYSQKLSYKSHSKGKKIPNISSSLSSKLNYKLQWLQCFHKIKQYKSLLVLTHTCQVCLLLKNLLKHTFRILYWLTLLLTELTPSSCDCYARSPAQQVLLYTKKTVQQETTKYRKRTISHIRRK